MNVLCPHCYRLFPYERIRVKCTSGRCSDVLDTEGKRGARRLDPGREKLWAGRGRLGLEKPCPYCEESGRLVPACPNCWQILDRETGRVEDRMIAVLGARQAGKSHFLAALLHLLLEQRVGDGAWTVEIEPEMRKTVRRELLRPLFHELRELSATVIGSQLEIRLVLTHREDGRRVLLRFHDLSGEAMADPARLARVEFLRYASGVILLADPLAFEPRGKFKGSFHHEPTCLEILEIYRRVLDAAPRRAGQEELPLLPEQKFLAVTVTKADLMLHGQHSFWQPGEDSAHLARGFWAARREESAKAKAWLGERLDDPAAFDATAGLFADVSYFFVSSYGWVHKPHTTTLTKPPQPLRVHEPVFALLDRFAAEPRPGGTVAAGARHPAVVGDDEDDLL
jgi:hypothetical protein